MKIPLSILSYLSIVLIFCSSIYAQAPVVVSDQIEIFNDQKYYIHTVEAGQTLFGIAQAYNITLDELVRANPESRSGLRTNQVLRVPFYENPANKPPRQKIIDNLQQTTDKQEYIYHVAGRNERVDAIANKYQVSEEMIRQANPGMNELLREGDYISVPISSINSYHTELVPHHSPAQINQTRTEAETAEDHPSAKILKQDVFKEQAGVVAISSTEKPTSDSLEIDASQIQIEDSKLSEDFKTTTPGIHTVKQQETLYSIAKQYGFTLAQLLESNPGISQTLAIGQVLELPEREIPIQKEQETDYLDYIIHTVKKGETLYRIARNYAASIDILKQHNPGLTEQLSIGQQIRIPKKDIISPFIEHRVEDRTRSRVLARDYEISLDRFYNFNPSAGRRVYPGQIVQIPIADHLKVRPDLPKIEDTLQIEVPGLEIDQPELLVVCPEHPAYSDQKFRVALMMPFYLHESEHLFDNARFTPGTALKERPFSFLQFYEGFLLAVDSLVNNYGLDIELYVYDIDQDQKTISDALADPKLRGVDLIVGPFFSQSFEQAARYARDQGIPIVNPMAQRSEIIEGFPNVFKVKPSDNCQYDQLAALIAAYYPEAKIFLIRAHSFTAVDETQKVRSALNNLVQPTVDIPNQRIYKLIEERSRKMDRWGEIVPYITIENQRFNTEQIHRDLNLRTIFDNSITELTDVNESLDAFMINASTVRENVVIALSDDNVFAMELVNKLSQVADTLNVKLIGLPNWHNFENLFIESLLKMQAHYLVQSHVDYSTYQIERFIHHYRNQYNAEPAQYAYDGFDIGWFFLQSLMYYGEKMTDCVHHFTPELTSTQFRFMRENKYNGFENCFWNFYRYQDYKLVPLNNAYYTSDPDY